MKKLRLLFIVCIMLCGTLALAACRGPALDRPQGLKLTDDLKTLYWQSVTGASSYLVEVENGDNVIEYDAQRNSFDISAHLQPNINYSVRVKAVGDKVNFSNSKWSASLPVFFERENGLAYKLINGNTAYELISLGNALETQIEVPRLYRGLPVVSIGVSAFYNSARFTEITVPDTITSIGDRAFQNCSELTKFNTKTESGEVLENTIPSSVVSIGKNAFRSCRKLKSIVICDSVTSIDENAFAYCSGLTQVTLGKGIDYISKGVFRNCSALTSIVIPANVSLIEEIAFTACDELVSVKMESIKYEDETVEGVISIGADAFSDCQKLTTVDFGEAVVIINDNAFYNCGQLNNLKFPDTVASIGNKAFQKCTSLDKIDFGSNLQYIGRNAFYDTKLWNDAENAKKYVVYADKWILGTTNYMYNGTSDDKTGGQNNSSELPTSLIDDEAGNNGPGNVKNIVIRDDTIGIAGYAFSNSKTVLEKLYFKHDPTSDSDTTGATEGMPDSLLYINGYAFSRCKFLTVKLGKNVKYIDTGAFSYCSIMTELDLNGNTSLEVIGDMAFARTNLGFPGTDGQQPKHHAWPSSLKSIGWTAFLGSYYYKYYENNGNIVYVGGWVVGVVDNENIMNASITQSISASGDTTNEESITTVGIADYAFSGCKNLTQVTCPPTVKAIGMGAFAECELLTSFALPDGLEKISEFLFYGAGITTITIPQKVTSIGRSAFYGCSKLRSVTISASVTDIDVLAFYGARLSGGVKFEDNSQLTRIGMGAFSGAELTQIVIPAHVKTIEEGAFNGCSFLMSVTLNEELEYIGDYAFAELAFLSEITIPGSVKEIGNYAFRLCSSLTTLNLGSGLEKIGTAAFSSCTNLSKITIPDTVKEIGDMAFRDCSNLRYFKLGKGVESIGKHTFYADTNVTIFTELTSLPDSYSRTWNSSFAPVALGCKYSADGSYLTAITKSKNNIINLYSKNKISSPIRSGYEFIGWSKTEGGTNVDVKADDLGDVEDGTTLYAVWVTERTPGPETTPEQ